ncbi:dirigent protein 22 [Cajanus cajan]|uniref:Dirigent protein n=1 Tax=Cajanus cajan TaxID=3821 RepID=A0A151S929_CAJCA|nr:dirigent protein 22 [Cajanus cajan]KYP51325.1 Disease resistance response protein 206 family [Cajanus cajan]
MASLLSLVFAFNLIVMMSSSLPTTSSEAFAKESPMFVSPKPMEKITQLHFYFHDNLTKTNPTAMQIVAPPKGSVGGFGATYMMDDPLTEGTSPSSKLVGRSQGIYAIASHQELGLLMVLNFVFTEGIYNASTLSILGRNPIAETVREMPIVGGSGIFRYARGFALAKTYLYDPKSSVAIVEYNVSVLHF